MLTEFPRSLSIFFSFSLKKKPSEEARNDKWLKRVEVVLMMGGLFFCVMMSFSRVFPAKGQLISKANFNERTVFVFLP